MEQHKCYYNMGSDGLDDDGDGGGRMKYVVGSFVDYFFLSCMFGFWGEME